MQHSKLEQVFPLEQIPFPPEMTLIRVEPEEIEAMVRKLREDHLTIQPTQGPVERGDFVLLTSLEGGEDRLLNTARPMGAAALAESCLGRGVGEPATEIYRITRIKRRILPEFDAVLVQSAGLPDIRTPEQYRTHCLKTLRAGKTKRQTGKLARWLAEEWISRCRFYLDERELEEVLSELEGTVHSYMEEMSCQRENAVEMLGQMLRLSMEGSPDLRVMGERLMKRILLGQNCLAKYGVVLDRTRYEKALEKIAAEQGGRVEEYRQTYPYGMFLHEKAMVQIDTEAKKHIGSCAQFHYE